MVHYKLIYFNARGRGELARLVMHAAGVEFEDYRFNEADWPSVKPTLPFGQCPVLEVDGKMLAQSYTIARFLARQHGLGGKDNWEQAQADMYADCIYDLHGATRLTSWEEDPVKQKEMFDKLHQETVKPHVEKIEAHLVKNGTGYLVGDSLTWADIAYYAYLTTPVMTKLGGEVLSNAPHLKKLIETVGQVPGISKYVQTRPVTKA